MAASRGRLQVWMEGSSASVCQVWPHLLVHPASPFRAQSHPMELELNHKPFVLRWNMRLAWFDLRRYKRAFDGHKAIGSGACMPSSGSYMGTYWKMRVQC